MNLNPVMIHDLLSCQESHLPEIAKKHKIKPPIAAVIRKHWLYRLTGKCAQCGRYLDGDKCKFCNAAAKSNLEFLKKLPPKSILMWRKCVKCGGAISDRVAYVLKLTQKHGYFKPSRICSECKNPQNKKAATKETEHTKKIIQKIETEKVTPQQKKKTGPLTYKPFMALKELKIEK